MKTLNSYKLAAVLAAVLIAAFVVMISRPHAVKAASAGGVTGTIKLDGVAPHQKPIDMSKEPTCAAQHKDHPITTEGVVAGADGGLANAFSNIDKELRSQYLISYKPASVRPDGSFHRLVVLGPQKLQVHHPAGYFAR